MGLSVQDEFLKQIKDNYKIINLVISLYSFERSERCDLKQEIMCQAWKSFPNFKGKSKFSTWLYRVALNTVLSYNRKSGIWDKSKINTNQNDDKSENSNTERLYFEVTKLDDINKTIITLHLEDYANDEIAEIVGISKNNVAVKLTRIKKDLTNKLKQE